MQARSAVLALVMATATVTMASHGLAQSDGPSQAPAASEAMTDKARELYNEGRTLYGQQSWDKAHASFLAAWSLKKHWQIAGMLGHCEVRMGRYRDAAEHLTFSIRTGAGSASPGEMKQMQESLEQAKREVGTVRVQVDTDDADVRVNGRLVGAAPLYDPLFVEPGQHVLQARTNERWSAEVKVEVEAGGSDEVLLRVDQEAPVGTPEAGTTTEPVKPDGGVDAGGTGAEPGGRSVTPAIIGGAVAVVGLGLGIGFTMSANGKESDRDDAVAALGDGGCGAGTPYATQCAEIQELDDAAGSRRTIALGGFVVGGLALAGTAAYLLWPSSKDGESSARLTPLVGPSGGGFHLVGSF